jgi:hypothetical protein
LSILIYKDEGEARIQGRRRSTTMNPIVKYVVRVPGETSWSEHTTGKAALHECDKANSQIRRGHKVYAEHKNGDITGPYYPK